MRHRQRHNQNPKNNSKITRIFSQQNKKIFIFAPKHKTGNMKKIFYGLAIIAMALGLVGMITDGFISSAIGLVAICAGAVLMLLTFIIGKMMDKNVQDGFDKGIDMSIEMKVNHAISNARQNSFKAQSEIRRLSAWCNNAIFDTFHAEYEKAGQYYEKDKLMESYGDIKEKYSGKVSFETIDKCDNIVNDYKLKIDGYKERLQTFEKQEKEYIELKAKLKEAKQNEKRLARLEQHNEKLDTAAITEGHSIVAAEDNLETMTMSDIAREVEEKEIYYKQLEELNFKYK